MALVASHPAQCEYDKFFAYEKDSAYNRGCVLLTPVGTGAWHSGQVVLLESVLRQSWGDPLFENQGHPKWMKDNARFQTLLMKVKGIYSIEGNKITTKVDSDDVFVYIDTGLDYPEDTGIWVSRAEISWKNMRRVGYENAEYHAGVHARTIKREKMGVWNWDAVPITVAGDSLQVGGTFRFYKSRRKATSSLKRRQEYESVNFMSLISARKAILKRTSSKRKTRWALRTLRQAW